MHRLEVFIMVTVYHFFDFSLNNSIPVKKNTQERKLTVMRLSKNHGIFQRTDELVFKLASARGIEMESRHCNCLSNIYIYIFSQEQFCSAANLALVVELLS